MKPAFLTLVLVFLILVSAATIVTSIQVQAQGLPDLTFQQVGFDKPEPFEEGDTIIFTAIIVNQGDSDASSFRVETYLDGKYYQYNILPLGAHQSFFLYGGIWNAAAGTHTVTWIADTTNLVAESNENNNQVSRTFTVGLPTPGLPDLTFQKVAFDKPEPFMDGDIIRFGAIIVNQGYGDAYNFVVEAYLDNWLYDSGTISLGAGESATLWCDVPWSATEGTHTLTWIADTTNVVAESNENNNRMSRTFTVGPPTVTTTVTVTKTSTRTQTQRTETTVTTVKTTIITRTTDTTVLRTVTAGFTTVTQTLTGLITSTIYSPTVTVTVTSTAQMISNPILWLLLSTFAMLGAVVQLPKSEKLGRLLPELFRRVMKRHVRKILFTISLISLILLSISSQAGQRAYASTVTTTRTATVTEWTTLTQSLTSTRYITSTTTDTSTLTRTYTGLTTVTPTLTVTVDRRSLTTVYVPTTVTKTAVGGLTLSVVTDPEVPNLGEPYSLIVVVTNAGSRSYRIKVDVNEWPANDPAQQVGSQEYGLFWRLDTKAMPKSAMQVETASPGETRYVFRFVNSWNWIKPMTTVDLWRESFFYVLLGILQHVNPVFAVADARRALGDIVELYDTAELSVVAQKFYAQVNGVVEDTGQSLLGKTLDLVVRVPERKLSALSTAFASTVGALALTIGTLIITVLGILASGGVLAPALSFLVGAVSAAFFAGSFSYYVAAMDPDPSYTTVPTPPEVKIPSEVAGLPEGAAKTFATSALHYSSYMNASSVALARYAAAMVDNQEKYMLMQLNAAKNYLERANQELDKMIQFAAKFQQDLPKTDQSLIDKIRNYVKVNGLPEEMNRALEEMGWGAFKKDLRDIVAEAPPVLFGFPAEASIRYSSDALKNQTVDIQNTVSSLEAKLKQPSWTENYLPYLLVTLVAATGVSVYALYWRPRHRPRKDYPKTFCAHCGAEIPYGHETSYCIECGKPIRK